MSFGLFLGPVLLEFGSPDAVRDSMTIDLPTPDETFAFGRRLGESLQPGTVVALIGPLGAGKTTLVRAIAAGLGVDPRQVSSPTFALIHEYQGRLPIFHFDTYRLPDEAAFAGLGVDEYFAGSGVCLVEWADRVQGLLPNDCLRIELTPTGETSRRVKMSQSE